MFQEQMLKTIVSVFGLDKVLTPERVQEVFGQISEIVADFETIKRQQAEIIALLNANSVDKFADASQYPEVTGSFPIPTDNQTEEL